MSPARIVPGAAERKTTQFRYEWQSYINPNSRVIHCCPSLCIVSIPLAGMAKGQKSVLVVRTWLFSSIQECILILVSSLPFRMALLVLHVRIPKTLLVQHCHTTREMHVVRGFQSHYLPALLEDFHFLKSPCTKKTLLLHYTLYCSLIPNSGKLLVLGQTSQQGSEKSLIYILDTAAGGLSSSTYAGAKVGINLLRLPLERNTDDELPWRGGGVVLSNRTPNTVASICSRMMNRPNVLYRPRPSTTVENVT